MFDYRGELIHSCKTVSAAPAQSPWPFCWFRQGKPRRDLAMERRGGSSQQTSQPAFNKSHAPLVSVATTDRGPSPYRRPDPTRITRHSPLGVALIQSLINISRKSRPRDRVKRVGRCTSVSVEDAPLSDLSHGRCILSSLSSGQ